MIPEQSQTGIKKAQVALRNTCASRLLNVLTGQNEVDHFFNNLFLLKYYMIPEQSQTGI